MPGTEGSRSARGKSKTPAGSGASLVAGSCGWLPPPTNKLMYLLLTVKVGEVIVPSEKSPPDSVPLGKTT